MVFLQELHQELEWEGSGERSMEGNVGRSREGNGVEVGRE